ncbi:MAG: hotdog domain-containing protein [Eggerthellaceae bacterium]
MLRPPRAACLLLAGKRARSGLTGIDGAKFRRQVVPGDTVRLEAIIAKSSRRMCVAEVKATVDGQVAASAVQKYVLA